MKEFMWRIECHIWFQNYDEYAEREKELHELLGKLCGDGSVTVFFFGQRQNIWISQEPVMITWMKSRLMSL